METFQYTITDEIGIHARPAGELAKLAKEFQSKITIKTETKQADAERLMAVMALGIRHGQTVTVETVGPDETEAVSYTHLKQHRHGTYPETPRKNERGHETG